MDARDPAALAHHPAWVIPLAGARRLSRGAEKEVFERPGKPSQVVKVFRDDVVRHLASSRRLKLVLRRRGLVGPYKTMLRQHRAFLDAMLLAPGLGRPPPLAQPRGVVLTERGLGQLCQKIRDETGALAPTLSALARDGRLGAELVAPLNAFVADIYAFNIVVTDLSPPNVVLEARRGRRRFVLIDGFGCRTLVPLRRWSRRANARRLDRLFDTLGGRIGLAWDKKARAFRPPVES